ncbi:ABC transporter permease [Salisaeta longa]|uniref:ABC transporter permease n=1 Tax=Salisaeta longa TaxID=503170 RepID=UPI0003B73023|nr:ABC transporter permease [Salisaeta longa]
MNTWDTFRMALNTLGANKLRSGLTLVGMVIGVFAVIASVTAVEVIDVYFKESLQFFSPTTVSIDRYERGRGDEVYHPPLTYQQVVRLKDRASGDLKVSVTEAFEFIARVRFKGRETEPNIRLEGTDQHFLGNYGYAIAAGRPLTPQDVRYGRPVALIGAPVAETLFPNETPLGKMIEVGSVRLEVVGVLEEKGGFLGMDYDTRVYAPITYLLTAYGGNGRSMNSITVRAASMQRMQAARDEIISHLRVIRGVKPGQPNNFVVQTNDEVRSTFASFTTQLTIGGALIGLISLLAAGIGIMNIMLVSVTERTREIGVRKAIGAKRRHILQQFLIEAIVLCQIGGLAGIVLGGLFGNGVALYFDISAAFPWLWAVAAVLGVTGIAVVFGGYPAYKAARLDPIESLRYE